MTNLALAKLLLSSVAIIAVFLIGLASRLSSKAMDAWTLAHEAEDRDGVDVHLEQSNRLVKCAYCVLAVSVALFCISVAGLSSLVVTDQRPPGGDASLSAAVLLIFASL
jgi:hypothetical protein